jgi:hypothetical protein
VVAERVNATLEVKKYYDQATARQRLEKRR